MAVHESAGVRRAALLLHAMAPVDRTDKYGALPNRAKHSAARSW